MWNITGTSPEPWTEHFVNVTYIYILWPFMHTHNAHRTCDTHSPTKRCDMQPQPNTTKTHTQAWPGIAMKINFSNFWCVIFMDPKRPCASASRAVAHERVQRTYNAIVWLHVTLSGRHTMCMCVCLSACAYVSTRHWTLTTFDRSRADVERVWFFFYISFCLFPYSIIFV